MKHFFLSLFIFIVFVTQAQTAPQKINYQGLVRSANGNPIVTTSITVRFRILQTSTTGSVSFAETHTTSTNALGLFNLQIGSVNNNLANVNWANGPYFLEVGIDTLAGGNFLLLGTQQLVSVPYALQAGSAPSPAVSFTNNILTVGTSTASIPTGPSTGTANINITGINGATVSSGPNYTVNAPPQLTLTTSGASTIGGTYPTLNINTPSVTISPYPLSFGGLLSFYGSYPNYLLTVNPTVTYSSSTGLLYLTNPTTSVQVSYNITPNLQISQNTITVGPPYNTMALTTPSAQVFNNLFVSLGLASVSSSGASVPTGGLMNFTKQSSSSEIDLYLHSEVSVGSITGGGKLIFELRVDGNASTVSSEHVLSSNGNSYITLRAIFSGLIPGPHIVSVWARTNTGTANTIVLDPNTLGGKVILKETY